MDCLSNSITSYRLAEPKYILFRADWWPRPCTSTPPGFSATKPLCRQHLRNLTLLSLFNPHYRCYCFCCCCTFCQSFDIYLLTSISAHNSRSLHGTCLDTFIALTISLLPTNCVWVDPRLLSFFVTNSVSSGARHLPQASPTFGYDIQGSLFHLSLNQ